MLDLSLRGGDVVSKLEPTGARITETIVTRGDKVTETFRENAEHLASTVATQGDSVRDMLAARLQAFEEMFSHGGAELAEKITQHVDQAGRATAEELDPLLRVLLVAGAHQIEYSRGAPEVSVHLSVDAARALGLACTTGLVNAVLRRFARDRGALFAAVDADLAVRSASPPWLVEARRPAWPEDVDMILEGGIGRR